MHPANFRGAFKDFVGASWILELGQLSYTSYRNTYNHERIILSSKRHMVTYPFHLFSGICNKTTC